ncbi:MAG: TlpA disulfide reductase family protein [candidate division FCPU426 bacterium]
MSNWKIWRWIVGFFLMATAWGVVGVRSTHSPEPSEIIITHGPRGEPPFIRSNGREISYGLPLLTGAWRSSQTDRGTAVIICFWAPWCDPCRDVMAWLVQYQSTLTRLPVALLTVAVETDMQSLLASDLQLPTALSPEPAGITRLPQLWLVSPEGRLLWQGEGYASRLVLETEVDRWIKPDAAKAGDVSRAEVRP